MTTRAVSVVMPCLDDRDLLERTVPRLLEELAARAAGDEVVVVDDTGRDVLAGWLAEHFPAALGARELRVVARERNGGFAAALLEGVRGARHERVFCMNPDVLVRPGFLDPLVECLEDESVHSVAPRVLLNGEEDRIESVTEIALFRGLGSVHQPRLERGAGEPDRLRPVAYAIGGTCLLRRSDFLASNGFDPLYEPFYWEDVDLGWMAWRRGRRVLYQPASVVEHHHRGTIGKRVPPEFVRAAIEKNRLLFQWKALDSPRLLEEHVAALYRMAVDAYLSDRRDELVWLSLALEQVEECLASRAALPPAQRTFDEIQQESSGG